MKFYNVFSGFLTGSTRDAFVRNIGDRVFNSLHSYWYLKDCDDQKILDGFSLTKGDIMIDSGAFTAWSKQIDLDVDKYLAWINKWDKYITNFGQIDVIPPKDATYKEINECCKKTWDNYLYMTERMNSPKKLLYTFHYGEPYKWLRQALEYRDKEGKPIEYMAIGGLVGRTTRERKTFLEACFALIQNSSNPNIKVHGFGVSSKKMWTHFGFESCDSFTPGMNANHGFTYDEYGAYRPENYAEIFKPRGRNKEEQEILDKIEASKSLEQLQQEALERTDKKVKVLINNIEYWTELGKNTPKSTVKYREPLL